MSARAVPRRAICAFTCVCVALALVPLAGCGKGAGKLKDDISLILAPYLIVDLTTGTITAQVSVPNLTTNAAYKSTLMVFRRVPAGNGTTGTPLGGLGAGVDAPAGSASVGSFCIGVFEVTQAQWQAIAGVSNTPWTTLSVIPGGAAGSLSTQPDKPAFGISEMAVRTAIQTYNVGKLFTLAVPTDTQWEYACRGGSATAYSWGSNNANLRSLAIPYAVVLDTNSTNLGPNPVGQKVPNAFGLYDMHGNVWELTHTGLNTSIRGGSWNDPLSEARSANTVALDRGTSHALVGVRLVLVP